MQIKKSVTDFAKSLDKPSDEKINAHEGVFYLIGPDGDFRKAFGHDEDSQKIALAVSPDHSTLQMLLSLLTNPIKYCQVGMCLSIHDLNLSVCGTKLPMQQLFCIMADHCCEHACIFCPWYWHINHQH